MTSPESDTRETLNRRAETIIFPLLLLAVAALLAAIWAGWVRLGWGWPVWQPGLVLGHGPLMISAFLGSLIALERAVALQQRWMFSGPMLCGLGGMALMLGFINQASALLIALGGLVFVAIMAVIVRRQAAPYTVTMLVGALAWQVGNFLWLAGWPVYRLVVWWMIFLILTIVAERLELGRLVRLPRSAEIMFVIASAILLVGSAMAMWAYDAGLGVAGAGMVALSVWLLRYDVARHTVLRPGLPRFAGAALLSGYVWLGIGGLVGLGYGGARYDAFLHTVLIGFVISMIFGHAPIIFPSVLRLPITFHPIFYLSWALLHFSLILRITGDLAGVVPLRLWGGFLNGLAILLFLASIGYVVSRAQRAQAKALMT